MARPRSLKSLTPSPRSIKRKPPLVLSHRSVQSNPFPEVCCQLPPLLHPPSRLQEMRLPRTQAPSLKLQSIKRRFEDVSETRDRIPSEDWLSVMLYGKSEFVRKLCNNIEKCRGKLAQHRLVQEAISEEDWEYSELPSPSIPLLSSSAFK